MLGFEGHGTDLAGRQKSSSKIAEFPIPNISKLTPSSPILQDSNLKLNMIIIPKVIVQCIFNITIISCPDRKS
ncbi:hypothetical protein SPLC1_S052020 [Arthrospira platensis C1]|nr:hypothetical protein SPLC1_S052020 [Arthrospira platensis C1]